MFQLFILNEIQTSKIENPNAHQFNHTRYYRHYFNYGFLRNKTRFALMSSSSSSNEEISNVVDSDGDDDEDPAIGKKQRGRRRGYGFGKAKEMVQHQFTKAKRQVRRIRSKRALLRSSSSSGNASVKGSGKMIIRDDDDTRNGTPTPCKFCFSRPRVLESPNESPTSDPNNPNFTFAMLKTLIEQNDFYCRECNPHVD